MNDRSDIGEPLDTSDVQLPEDIAKLTEKLAEQIHRAWAAGRIAEGWTYGPRRDDQARTHPCLVPYDQLPESEKQYDRRTCLQTLKTLTKLGYRLQPADAAVGATTDVPVEELHDLLRSNELPLIDVFKRLYPSEDQQFWSGSESFHIDFVKALTSEGHAAAAVDYAGRALEHQPESLWLRYRQALALARGRSVRRARNLIEDLLGRLPREGESDPELLVEALSLAGRLFKDMGRTARQRGKQKRYFQLAQQRYGRAYELADDWFPAINAATMAMLAGDTKRAQRLAKEVIAKASRGLDRFGNTDDYWLLATLGEAALICQRFAKAIDLYGRAVRMAGSRIGDIASMRRNVELLSRRIDMPDELMRLFVFGNVIVFAGHMIDHPDRTARHKLPARFPPIRALEHKLADAIAQQIARINPVIGYCSIANGSDILFAEQMLARGLELHIVLPFDLDDFMHTSVTFGIPQMAEWRKRALAVLDKAQVHYATRERFLGDHVLYEFTNRIMQGLAILRAEEFGVVPHALVAFEVDSIAGGKAGTAAFHKLWARQGRQISVIDVGQLRRTLPAGAKPRKMGKPKPPPAVEGATLGKRRIAYMLFSDVQNFSRLKEEHTPAFLSQFMRIVRSVLRHGDAEPSFANTWGDALYLVFDSPVTCADFALRLLRRMEKVDWTRHHLPAETAMRIGLHAGPVYRRHNAILDRQDVFGSHVNLAARIEPVTTPGSAWVSEHFAAELALAPDHDFACDYVGIQELPKRFGKAPLYRLMER